MTREELEARIAADTAELERLKAEPDRKMQTRYREALFAFQTSEWADRFNPTSREIIRALLAARNHDPDVVLAVQVLREAHGWSMLADMQEMSRRRELLCRATAPFAAIKGE